MLSRLVLLAAGGAMLATAAVAQTAPADPVVARVNGKELHRSDVIAVQKSLPAQYRQVPIDMIYPQLLDQLVTGMLVADEGRKEKLDQSPEVKQRIARYEDRAVQEAWIDKEIAKAATEDKLKERYAKFLKENPPKEEVSARHILVKTEAEAKAIIKELDNGADFATLAKQKSTDPAAKDGGDLGYFTRDTMVPAFADAAFKLKKGEYTKEPVKTQFGWHVIKVEDRRTAPPPSLEETREQLTDQIAREVITEKVKELRAGAKIETFGLDGKPMPQEGAAAAPAKQ